MKASEISIEMRELCVFGGIWHRHSGAVWGGGVRVLLFTGVLLREV